VPLVVELDGVALTKATAGILLAKLPAVIKLTFAVLAGLVITTIRSVAAIDVTIAALEIFLTLLAIYIIHPGSMYCQL
jgi:hypothetical protein